ncbi:MAG: gliding motility-associated C-terminal domain-containing protein [Leadbetterella sp.]|nr:gliding motility-associated C-terminal domain-containing protein [Leadbetterella sp.]
MKTWEKICQILLLILFLGVPRTLHAQFYVSPKVCIADLSMDPSTGQMIGCEKRTSFFDTEPLSIAWMWDFGDSGQSNSRNPQYVYQASGPYTVTLTRTLVGGITETKTKQITVGKYPTQPKFNDKISADTTVCESSSLELNPFKLQIAGNVKYRWFPTGDTTKTITVDTTGCYSVEVYDAISGCSRSAKINVKFCLQESSSGGGIEKWFFGKGGSLEFGIEGDSTERDSLAVEGDLNPDLPLENPAFKPSNSNEVSKVNTSGAVAMVYDKNTNLVFYTDGNKLFAGSDDTEIQTASGGNFSIGNTNSSQGLMIVPKSNCNACNYTEYFVLSQDPLTKLLSYSVVDMRYNNRRGAVVEQNIPLLFTASEKMAGIRSSNDSAFVLYSFDYKKGAFNILTIDSTGINTTEQIVGSSTLDVLSATGYIAISPNGRKLAHGVVINGKNYVEVFDRNLNTNRLSDPILIDLDVPAPPTVYGVAFGSNSDILYTTIKGNPALGQDSQLIQLALFLGDAASISDQKEIISRRREEFGALMLGPVYGIGEKYLYMSVNNKDFLPYLQNPDVKGNAAVVGLTYVAGSASFGAPLDGLATMGLPNILAPVAEQEGDGITANYSGNCQNSPTVFTTQGICSPMRNKVTWYFDDGTQKEGTQTSYTYTKPGWHTIKMVVEVFQKSKISSVVNNQIVDKLTETECTEEEYTGTIYIKPAPILDIPDKLYICLEEFEKKPFSPNPKGGDSFKYLWTTILDAFLSNNPTYIFDIPATYKLEVTNNFECVAKDKLTILEGCEPTLFLPDVFTPNDDNINNDFSIIPAYITDFDFKVFNRWGELVFNSKNPEIKWDGKFKGKIYGNQLYPYTINYRSKYFPERGQLQTRGSILILK